MELRQGYKQTEVGVIPNEWEVKKLGDISDIIGGGTPSSFINSYWNGSVNWFTPTEIGKEKYSYESVRKISKLGYENCSAKILPVGTILLTTRAGIGDVSILMNEGCTNQGFQSFVTKDNIYNEYLYYVLSTLKNVFLQNASGSTFLEISPNKIKAIQIPLPPTKAEQTAIANALSDADALISSLEKLIEKKRNIKQGAMQELLKPKKGWVVKKLGEIGECIIGLTYSPDNVKESGLLVLRSSNVQGNTLHYDNNVYVDIDVPEKLIVKENDILICVRNGSRDLIGKCALIKGKAIGETFGAFMSVFRSPFNEFVFGCFQSNVIKKQIDEHLGATINQITNKSLNSFEIPFPPPNEQDEIVNILRDMDNEIMSLEKKLSKSKMLKQGMMQELLTGKIRLV